MGTVSGIVLTFLVNAAWQTALVLAVAGATAALLRRSSMAQRHALWSAAMLAAVLLPLASVSVPAPAPEAAAGESTGRDRDETPGGSVFTRAVPLAPSSGVTIGVLFFALTAFGAGRLIAALRGVRKIRREARPRPLTPAMIAAEEQCRAALGLMPVPILCSATVGGPLTIGDLDPVIVLPEGLYDETSPELLRSVIGHEMAHIARRDYLQKLVLEALFIPVSFHPAAWYLKRRIDQARELACDETVTREMVAPPSYAQSMVEVARAVALFRKPACSLGVLDGDILERRIRILLRPGARLGPRAGKVLLVLATLLLAAFAVKAAGYSLGIATAGRLSGRVLDPSGAIVPSAKVTITDHLTGVAQVRSTSATGDFSFESLPVGRYTLTVEQRGFARLRLNKINPGRVERLNLVLQLGRVAETITVSTKLPK